MHLSKMSETNPFELHCIKASQKKLCWDLFCSTCGAGEFRYGIYATTKGFTPKNPAQWKSLRNSFRRPILHYDFSFEEYSQFSEIAKNTSLRTLSETCLFPDWIGYLGICLNWFELHERDHRLLTIPWGAQLLDLCKRKDYLPMELIEKIESESSYLNYQDLEFFERALRPNRF